MRRGAVALLALAACTIEGGIKLSYRDVPGAKAVVEKRLRKLMLRSVHVVAEGDVLAVYVPGGNRIDDAKQSLALPGTFEVSFVVEGNAVLEGADDAGVTLEHETAAGPSSYLHAATREALSTAAKVATLPSGRLLISKDSTGFRTWVLDEKPVLSGDRVVDAADSVSPEGGLEVGITLDDAGKQALAEATAAGINRRFAIILDGEVMSAPVVMGRIAGGRARIALGAGAQLIDARALASALKSGALSQPLILEKEEPYTPRKW